MQNSVWPVIQQAGESKRQTVWVQGVGVTIMVSHLTAVTLLWLFGMLGLYSVFAAIAFEYLVAAIVTQRRYNHPGEEPPAADEPEAELVWRKYLRYCLPLLPYSWIGFAYTFADRWLLQKYGGGVQQAYYAIGAQFAGIALIATSSIISIFWKEVAEAHHQGDHARAGRLYQKVSRLLFLIGAIIAGFLVPWSEDLLRLVLGTAYAGGATTLAIMFIYPVHQSMGHIGGAMLYATERVKIQVITGSVFMIASMGVTYLVLAPPDAAVPGLGMASQGLAIKMVAMQFIMVNMVAYIIARIWKWRFDWIYQPASLFGCLALGWIAKYLVGGLSGGVLATPLKIGLAGVVYMLLMAGFVYALPALAGFAREELERDVRELWSSMLKLAGQLRHAAALF